MQLTISLQQFTNILSRPEVDTIFIDVRTPAEYREIHISGVRNIPLADLPSKIEELRQYKKIYIHCKSGARTDNACKVLGKAGIDTLCKIEGGIDDWIDSDLPIIRGKQTISIMRQVQICAGSLTLAGVILGYLVHPNWFYLSGFVGAGLLFAGISNTCAMAALLSKMPWNK